MVINAVGHLAEAAWHHPDIAASYAWVEVKLQNHSAKGITDKDFELARKIEDFVSWRPGKRAARSKGRPPAINGSPISSTTTSERDRLTRSRPAVSRAARRWVLDPSATQERSAISCQAGLRVV